MRYDISQPFSTDDSILLERQATNFVLARDGQDGCLELSNIISFLIPPPSCAISVFLLETAIQRSFQCNGSTNSVKSSGRCEALSLSIGNLPFELQLLC